MAIRQPVRETTSTRKSFAAWRKMMCHCSAATLRDRLVVVVKAPRLVLPLVASLLCSLVLLVSPAAAQTTTTHTARKSAKSSSKAKATTKRTTAKGRKKKQRMTPRVRRVREHVRHVSNVLT